MAGHLHERLEHGRRALADGALDGFVEQVDRQPSVEQRRNALHPCTRGRVDLAVSLVLVHLLAIELGEGAQHRMDLMLQAPVEEIVDEEVDVEEAPAVGEVAQELARARPVLGPVTGREEADVGQDFVAVKLTCLNDVGERLLHAVVGLRQFVDDDRDQVRRVRVDGTVPLAPVDGHGGVDLERQFGSRHVGHAEVFRVHGRSVEVDHLRADIDGGVDRHLGLADAGSRRAGRRECWRGTGWEAGLRFLRYALVGGPYLLFNQVTGVCPGWLGRTPSQSEA